MSLTLFWTVATGGCFIAGTLVHTDKGLIPIEQIKIGDRVLSQSEQTGEQTYKRVTRTTRFEDAPVWSLAYFRGSELERAEAEKRMMPLGVERRLVVTPNHPLWIRGKGWIQVKDIDFDGDELLLCDGDYGFLAQVSPIYCTGIEGVAWQQDMFNETDGELIDLRNGASGEFQEFRDKPDPQSFSYWDDSCYIKKIELGNGSCAYYQGASVANSIELWDESFYYRCTVYNFEVEDCHTYYVGTEGAWVHDTSKESALAGNAKCL